jgi:hypothetical protein
MELLEQVAAFRDETLHHIFGAQVPLGMAGHGHGVIIIWEILAVIDSTSSGPSWNRYSS